MDLLALDIGSSSVRGAVLRNGRIAGPIARAGFPTRFEGVRAEVDATAVLRALTEAIAQVGQSARRVDAIALANMAPSWVAMDAKGKPLTPIITHQDRRSVDVAMALENRVGKERHLSLAGNRPFPGGISSTTWAWFIQHQRGLMKKADLVGHLNTFLHRQLTGARVTDSSNASFMGVYSTLDLSGWSEELVEAVGGRQSALPEVRDANQIAGRLTPEAARRLGLPAGLPMTVGCMDGSAAMLLAGARPGQMFNVSGSTDVLALCTDRPRPHERLLTRALGIGRLWLSVSTLAAAGTALLWAKEQLYPDLTLAKFQRLLAKLAEKPEETSVQFEPHLAGDRMSIEQRQGAFTGLTLSTTRQHMLVAIIEALARTSAERLPLLAHCQTRMCRTIMVSGGVQTWLAKVIRRDWPGPWHFRTEQEATLRGLGKMAVMLEEGSQADTRTRPCPGRPR